MASVADGFKEAALVDSISKLLPFT
jgi:hypothetical protein